MSLLSGSHLSDSHLNNEGEDEAEDKADNWARLICPALINFRHHARNQSEIQTVPCSSAMIWPSGFIISLIRKR